MAKASKGSYGVTAMVALKSDHTGPVTVDADFLPTAVAATVAADIVKVFNQKFGTTVAITSAGKGRSLQLDTDQYDSEVLTVIDNFRVGAEAAEEAELPKYENNVEAPSVDSTSSGDSEATNDAAFINYGADDPADNTNVIVYLIAGNFSEDSGGYTQNNTDRTKPSMTVVSKKAKAEISIPAAMFDSTIVTVAAAQVIPAGRHFVRLTLPKAT